MTDLTATLLISCPDQQGLVAKIANFIYANGGNIIHADHHTDFTTGLFLSRIEWQLEGFYLPPELIGPTFNAIAQPLNAQWKLHLSNSIPRIAIFVSQQDHCLFDLILRQKAQEFIAEIPLIISNHENLRAIGEQFGIDYHYFPITKENKHNQEKEELELLKKHNIDLVILGKYMQVLSPYFIKQFPQIINIHHSFLPAFVGAKPYHQAYKRGVKIIGATAHYVTEDLDAGPIIEQNIVRVSHRQKVKDLIREGKDLERIVLAKAVRLHLEHRVLVYGNRTVVFE
jgi:formyltetrahydrofolate deformylase